MNLILFKWICPLQNRTKEAVVTQERSFMKAWSVVYPILLYYVAGSICIMLFAYFMQWISSREGIWAGLAEGLRQYSTIASAVVNGFSMLVGTAVVYPAFKREKIQIPMPASHKKESVPVFLAGAMVALCFNILFSLLQITGSSQSYAEVAERQFSLPLWAGLILYGIVSPVAEEIVFRGLVYNRLHRLFGLPFAVIGSAVLFGVYHGNVVQALYGFILGLFIAVLYERYGSFAVPVLSHSAANICIYVISANELWQETVMNWGVCAVSGVTAIILFGFLLFPKKKE